MKLYLLIFFLFISSITTAQTEIKGVEFPETITIENDEASLSGVGVRKKLWVDVYAIGLYHNESTTIAKKIIQSKKPMGVRIQILSRFVAKTKFLDAAQEGFEKSTHNHTKEIKTKIEYFLSLLDENFTYGDVCDILYHPDTGVKVYRDGELQWVIKGTKFKEALYGIWLSDQPVDKDLRYSMIGTNSKGSIAKNNQ